MISMLIICISLWLQLGAGFQPSTSSPRWSWSGSNQRRLSTWPSGDSTPRCFLSNFLQKYGCFQKKWYPQIIHFNRVFHYKPSILGYHCFWKHPYLRFGVKCGFFIGYLLISLEGLACSFYRKCHAKMTSLKDVHEPHSCFTGLSPPKHSRNHRRSCVGFYGKMCCNTSGGAKL